MNNLQTFSNSEFGTIRTIEENGQIWFCGKDVAEALGFKDTPKAIKQHCREDGWANYPVIDSMGRTQQARFINEPNLYRLITHSKLPNAEKFERWVFEDVLPSIRRTGTYGITDVSQRELTKDDYIRAASMVASCRNERLPYVLGFLEQGGFKIPKVEQMMSQEKDFVDVQLLSDLLNSTTMTLKEISQLTNISKTSLSYYKNRKNKPSPERYAILIQVLN